MRAVSLEDTFTFGRDTMFRALDGGAVILNLDSGTYFGLNEAGARIWQLLEHHGRLRAVLDELCQEYEASPDVLERDLLTLVARLADARLGEVNCT